MGGPPHGQPALSRSVCAMVVAPFPGFRRPLLPGFLWPLILVSARFYVINCFILLIASYYKQETPVGRGRRRHLLRPHSGPRRVPDILFLARAPHPLCLLTSRRYHSLPVIRAFALAAEFGSTFFIAGFDPPCIGSVYHCFYRGMAEQGHVQSSPATCPYSIDCQLPLARPSEKGCTSPPDPFPGRLLPSAAKPLIWLKLSCWLPIPHHSGLRF